jgi:hypothetical protein
MSADHEALIHTAKQGIAMGIALVHTMVALRREMEKRLDDSEAGILRT